MENVFNKNWVKYYNNSLYHRLKMWWFKKTGRIKTYIGCDPATGEDESIIVKYDIKKKLYYLEV